jgi:hypothetical protein
MFPFRGYGSTGTFHANANFAKAGKTPRGAADEKNALGVATPNAPATAMPTRGKLNRTFSLGQGNALGDGLGCTRHISRRGYNDVTAGAHGRRVECGVVQPSLIDRKIRIHVLELLRDRRVAGTVQKELNVF